MREILLIIHILGAGTWLGANVTQAVVTPKLRAQGGIAAAAWMKSIAMMGRVLYTPAAIIILVTGFWMVLDSDVYDFEQAFVVIGIVAVVIERGARHAHLRPQSGEGRSGVRER